MLEYEKPLERGRSGEAIITWEWEGGSSLNSKAHVCFLGYPLSAAPPLLLPLLLFPNAHSLGPPQRGGGVLCFPECEPIGNFGEGAPAELGVCVFPMMLVSGVWKLWLNC